MKIEDIFKLNETGTLTYAQFQEAAKDAKFVDLKEGGYVSQAKFDSELSTKNKQIEELNTTIADRDKDLEGIRKQLEDAGQDADKLSTLSTEFSTLQKKYDEDKKAYEAKLSSQSREFAIKEYASTKKFTSDAAKRDYIHQMKESSEVKLSKGGELVGMDTFDADYVKANETAFVRDVPEPTPAPAAPAEPKPQFVGTTPGVEPAPKKPSLSEMMQMANENPGAVINF